VAELGVTGFRPSANGLHFSNAFPDQPALIVDLGVATLQMGNAANGLCGGMVFAALDYWTRGSPPPPDTIPPEAGTALASYLVRRLIDSWDLPRGPLTYLTLMNPVYPDGDRRVGPVTVPGRARRMISREWPAIRASLDAGRPCPLGVVRVRSANPLELGKNHQVLAYGYDLTGSDLRLAVYDPNRADDDGVVLGLDLADPESPVAVTAGGAGAEPSGILCFFTVPYRPKTPPLPERGYW
jgi:hypothetical protein